MISHYSSTPVTHHVATSSVPANSRPKQSGLHRLREVREREGVSLRTMARRLQLSESEVERQEEEPNLRLTTLAAWAEALEVPLAELVGDVESAVSERIAWRAQFVHIMRTVRTIESSSSNNRIQRLTRDLVDRLLAMMPELHDVGALPAFGQRLAPWTSRIEELMVSTHLIPMLADEPDSFR